MIAEVIINSTVKNLNKIFDYNVPAELAGTIRIGLKYLYLLEGRKVRRSIYYRLKKESDYK